MEELILKLVEQAEIDDATAEKVIEVVKEFLSDKLPSPIDKTVEKYLDGVDGDDLGDALDIAKGLFGK